MTKASDHDHILKPLVARDDASLRSLLSTILASVPDAMVVSDQKGKIVAFSAAAENLFGYTVEQVIGKNVSLLMTEIDRNYHDQYMTNYLETGEAQIIGMGRVVAARMANGDTLPVELKVGEAKLGTERLFTGYIRDVSEQRAAQHRIQQMQAELTNFTRLSAVGTMASAIAHELNQPLTAVANYLEAARDLLTTRGPDTVQVAQDALSAASLQSVRAGEIIRRLRDYVTHGEIETRPVQLAPLASDAAALARIGLSGPLPRIVEAIDDDIGMVMADGIQLRQVFINLVRNAIEATGDMSNPQIWISACRQGSDEIRVEVRDNGPGVQLQEDEDVFQPFSSSKATGMGLGLAICQTIIEGHGGKIWSRASVDDGAAFCFTLKRASTGEDS